MNLMQKWYFRLTSSIYEALACTSFAHGMHFAGACTLLLDMIVRLGLKALVNASLQCAVLKTYQDCVLLHCRTSTMRCGWMCLGAAPGQSQLQSWGV